MIVTLIASTAVTMDGWELLEDFDGTGNADHLAEIAGRECYQSWHRPNPKTATNEGYLDNIIKQQHFSVLEHASATFRLDGVSRSLTHELVRHRHLSFSMRSQRYVDESSAAFVIPPDLRGDEGVPTPEAVGHMINLHSRALNLYAESVDAFMEGGMDRKHARQAARAVLPNGTATSLIVTGNLRAWREVIHKRFSVHADAEICEMAGLILEQLRDLAPHSFQDFGTEPRG